MKSGYQTTEFWTVVVTGLFGGLASLNPEVYLRLGDMMPWIAMIVSAYAASRGVAKLAGK